MYIEIPGIYLFFPFNYSLIDAMRMIGIICLLSFCGPLSAASMSPEVIPEPSTFINEISQINWNLSNNIEFNSDILSTPEMIRKDGYPVEIHVIMTEDGYFLRLHRIPGDNNSLPVLLQHGLLCSSADWVILGKGKALAYLLADQGYDVWMGNFRGTIYSRKHISLSTSDLKFWDFSINEIAMYDLPAMITFIINIRSQPLHTYIGHSMGTTSFYIMASKRPEMAQMIRIMISLAPAIFINHMQSPVRYIVPFKREFQIIMDILFHGEFLQDFLRSIIRNTCNQNVNMNFCIIVIFLLFGFDHEQLNYILLPVILSHFPTGASAKTIVHYAQILESDKFRCYDYGRAKNLLMYHSAEPPEYDVTNITVPIAMFYGNNDWLVDPVDVKRTFRLLPNVIDLYEIPLPNFNHLDFLWGKDAPKLLYERILTIIRGENPKLMLRL